MRFSYRFLFHLSGLIGNTPKAFRDSLPRTETWAILAANRQQELLSHQVKSLLKSNNSKKAKILDEQLHGSNNNGNEDNFFDDNASDTESENNNDENNTLDDSPTGGSSSVGGNAKANSSLSMLMGQLSAIASRMQEDVDHNVDASFDSEFPQDQKLSSDTLCLWSSVEEVLPCICSNIRRPHSSDNEFELKEIFQTALKSASEKYCFLISSVETMTPLYFAIDCRKNEEKTMGLFPKAYSLDPEVIFDSDGLTELISILQPIAGTTHIVMIGSGIDYYKWFIYKFKYGNRKKKTKQMKKEYKDLIEEDSQKMNAIALSLIKRGFKFISILQGGFAEAVYYINRPESKLNLSSALVDVDKMKLYSFLNIPFEAQPKSSITSLWSETAPAAMKSVGNLISNWRQPKTGENPPPAAASAPVPPPAAADGGPPQPPADTTSTTGTKTEAAKQLLSGFGKSISMFGASSLENIKQKIASATNKTEGEKNEPSSSQSTQPHHRSSVFGDEGDSAAQSNLPKTEQERAQALAIHRMSGLKKGDQITISRAELPGAILFPCTKHKEVWVVPNQKLKEEAAVPAPATNEDLLDMADSEDSSQKEISPNDHEENNKKVKQEIVVSRYLVVSRERFMVLDANGGGVGSIATVKSNHHLTEVSTSFLLLLQLKHFFKNCDL
jgi:hypothetical protein